MTPCARWLVVIALAGLVAGLVGQRDDAVAHVSLAVLAWIGGEWLLLRWRGELVVQRLRGTRQILQEGKPVRTAWANRAFEVQTRVALEGSSGLAYVRLSERLPAAVEICGGSTDAHGPLPGGGAIELRYSVQAKAMGAVRFEGIGFELADLQGFYVARGFLPIVQTCPVLPSLATLGAGYIQVKRQNLLPPPGRHRHPRPGVGSELFQLREYVPGDPPKSIAWKVSARRDRLMTKEFESEVPVYCRLFLDVSNAVRVGYPQPTPLCQLAEAAAAIAQAAIEQRDPVSLCTFDESSHQTLAAGAGRRQMIRLLRRLCDVSGRPPAPVPGPADHLLAQAYALCETVYPDLLLPRVNRVPLTALPLLRRRRLRSRRVRLGTVLAEHLQLGPGAPVRMVYDDAYLAEMLQRFLGEHHVPYDMPAFHDWSARHMAARAEVNVLASALTRSLARARDNELIVILADVLELEDELAPLLTAVRIARSRHHDVALLCSWPAHLESPDRRGADSKRLPAGGTVEQLVHQADQYRFDAAYRRLRTALARLRVPVACVSDPHVVSRMMKQLDDLRKGAIHA